MIEGDELDEAVLKLLRAGTHDIVRVGTVPPWMKPYRPGVSSYDGLYELVGQEGTEIGDEQT